MAFALKIADPAAPSITTSVVWGLIPGARSATVSGTGAADGPALTRDGAFLRVGGPDAHPAPGARVDAPGATVPLGPGRLPSRVAGKFRWPELIAGTQRAEAPAPDPAGGPRWAVAVAQTREGTPCAGGPTRVVDGRTGGVDLRLALFFENVLTGQACRPLETRPSAQRPRGLRR
jgi:hypothetical protein